MGSLPKTDSVEYGMRKVSFLVPDTTLPDFEDEYRRQMAIIAEHDRRTGSADRMDIDEMAS